ncbi:MAG: hypothetical protein ABI892_19535, partial [Flavobacterium sp.]
GLRTTLKNLIFFSSVEEQYEAVRIEHNSLDWGTNIFFTGFLFFLGLLISASFFVSTIFGVITIVLAVVLLIFMFINMSKSHSESDFFNWDKSFNDIR